MNKLAEEGNAVKNAFTREVGEFKKFIARGNVIDMAVAVIMGGAFGKIITSLVNDILMPFLGLAIGKINIKELVWTIRPAEVDAAGSEIAPAVVMGYGSFLQNTLDFLLISFAIFVFLKIVLSVKNRIEEPPAPATPTEPSPTEKLLIEIRDILKKEEKDIKP